MTPDSRVIKKISETYTRYECIVCDERSKEKKLLTYCRWCGASSKMNRYIKRYGYCHDKARTCWKDASNFRISNQNLEGDELAKKMPDLITERFSYLYRKNGITFSGSESVAE